MVVRPTPASAAPRPLTRNWTPAARHAHVQLLVPRARAVGLALRPGEEHPHPHRGQQALWQDGARVRRRAVGVPGTGEHGHRDRRLRRLRPGLGPAGGRQVRVPRVDREHHRRGPHAVAPRFCPPADPRAEIRRQLLVLHPHLPCALRSVGLSGRRAHVPFRSAGRLQRRLEQVGHGPEPRRVARHLCQ